mmetsp:Transcript_41177/g.84236  ORF Transcript_41177/g.84236 Transcript_41177/m.84236 type:complete len:100 (+) Transcript_41177:1766-2065(+)
MRGSCMRTKPTSRLSYVKEIIDSFPCENLHGTLDQGPDVVPKGFTALRQGNPDIEWEYHLLRVSSLRRRERTSKTHHASQEHSATAQIWGPYQRNLIVS